MKEDRVFWHTCTWPGCTNQVEFDDEPKCYKHSPASGSSLYGYSARAETEREVVQ